MKTKKTLMIVAISAALVSGANAKPGGGGGGGGGAGGPPNVNSAPSTPTPHVAAPDPRATDTPRSADMPRADKTAKPEKPDNYPARSAAPAAQELSGSMRDINRAAFAQRRELIDDVDMRLQSSRDSLKQIQANAKDLRADARADFKNALEDVKARENELDAALKATRQANESNWNASRDRLAKAYKAHADALARVETLPRPPALPALPTP
jgi:hypothetical protein